MTENPPMGDPAVKLTKAQETVLGLIDERGQSFRVARAMGLHREAVQAPFQRLRRHGLIKYERSRWETTAAGRALLDALKDEGEV